MPDLGLERELQELGRAIAFPPTPDLTGAVRGRLAASAPRRYAWRRVAVVALALVAVSVGALMAVPQSRSAILEWLGLRGVSIERTTTRPDAPERPIDLGLGEPQSLDDVREQAGFPVAVPEDPGSPDDAYVGPWQGGTAASLIWRDDEGRPELLLTELRAGLDEDFVMKLAGPETTLERVAVGGSTAYWLAGRPHEVLYTGPNGELLLDTVRLAGNVLLWQRGDVTFRLEGAETLDEALRIAESVP